MDNDVTVVITSCKRHHLLQKTLKSFLKFNTYKNIEKIIIYEDSHIYPNFLKNFSCEIPIEILTQKKRIGHVKALDFAYSHVTTKYIFHCEDDWEFYTPSFIEPSKAILENRSDIYIVQLRGDLLEKECQNTTPEGGIEAPFCIDNITSFSLNPGLRRLSDYKKIGSYEKVLENPIYTKDKVSSFEGFIGVIYSTEFNLKMAFSLLNDGKGAVRHLGDNEHVRYHHRTFDKPLNRLKRWIREKIFLLK